MKIIVCIKKAEAVRFISHLDVQRNLQRTIRRADIPVAYSQGFSPHPLISFATALSVGQTGNCEWIEIKTEKRIPLEQFVNLMNANFPQGLSVTAAYEAAEGVPAVATLMEEAEYVASTDEELDSAAVMSAINELLCEPIIVTKTKKQGGRKLMNAEVDIRPMLYAFTLTNTDQSGTYLHVRGRLDASGGLNADRLLRALNEKIGLDISWKICRSCVKIKRFKYLDEYHTDGFDSSGVFM